MIFDKPIPFAEALEYRAAQRVLPTSAGSAELASLGADIRERALFSARTTNAGYLAKMDRMLSDMISPAARKQRGEMAVDVAQFRLQMRDELAKLGYEPERPGSVQDLGSDARLNLIADMQEKFAHGYGQHMAAQDPDLLDLWPCQEFVRTEARNDPRLDWEQRWSAAGGSFYGGRMIARKDDTVWSKLSAFGVPYPPFDYNSGMGVRDVRRDEAERLGVIRHSTVVQPDQRNLINEEVSVAMPSGISEGLKKTLMDMFKVQAGRIVMEALR
ncbi:hypothetical protein EGM51_10575 [Verrucomicrobia bacterium S94]|nr:hypothetical protein EGM51_10575 [Verrucomicrobia bacterium S94]